MNGGRGILAGEKPAGLAGAAVVAFAAVVIALAFVLARLVYDAGSNPLTLIALRYPAVILVLATLLRLRRRPLWLDRRDLPTAYGVGLVYFVGTSCYLASILYIPVSLAVLLFYSFPLMTVGLESLLGRRAPRPLDLVAFAAAFAGLALALQVSFADLDPRGIVFALLGALGASGSFVWAGRALTHIETMAATLHMSISGLLVGGVAVIVSGSFVLPSGGPWGWSALAGSILCFAAAFLAMFAGVRMIGALRTSMIMNLEPVATIALAVLLLGEALTPQQLVGAVLVIGAIVLTQRPARRAAG